MAEQDYDLDQLLDQAEPTVEQSRLMGEAREAVFIRQATEKVAGDLVVGAIDTACGQYRAGTLTPLEALMVFAKIVALKDFQDTLDGKVRGLDEGPQSPV